MKAVSQTKLIFYTAAFFTLFSNYIFFKNVITVYPLSGWNIMYVFSLALVLYAVMVFIFTLITSKHTLKPMLISLLFITAGTSYFINTYHVVIDANMIQNSVQTDMHEMKDLLSLKLLLYIVFLGVLPSYFIYKREVTVLSFKETLKSKAKVLILSLLLIVVIMLSFGKFYTSFLREHKPLRYYSNPTYWMYGLGDYLVKTTSSVDATVSPLGVDAIIPESETPPKLLIMVVGEAARADHFSLNGYERETNPLLKQEKIINFPDFHSCGTETAVSVPCMFSVYPRGEYSYKKGLYTENVLDVLHHTKKVSILWRDNNSNSKGVATRLPYEDFKTAQVNVSCAEGECRDEGMLVGLEAYIEAHKKEDILIVLHQMGNHGPSYYKRYPKAFEKFTPVCKSNQLETCSQESIHNAYDNALLYTDYFLEKTITFLKKYKNEYATSMMYVSDHGESLGEKGLYLHGFPYFMAPEAQTHVGAFMWFADNNPQQIDASKRYTQDNVFHTLLGLFNVKTTLYNKEMDILL